MMEAVKAVLSPEPVIARSAATRQSISEPGTAADWIASLRSQ
jgi:hypothetical protein